MSTQVTKLRADLKKVSDQIDNLLASTDAPTLTQTQQAHHNKLVANYDRLAAAIKRAQAAESRASPRAPAAAPQRTTPAPIRKPMESVRQPAARADKSPAWSADSMSPRRAYHEAGHCCLCLVLALRFTSVNIRPTAEYGGVVQIPDPDSIHPRDDLLMTLAGTAAESRFLGVPLPMGKGDSDYVEKALGKLCRGADPRMLLRVHQAETDRLLRDHWHRVQAVANGLLLAGELTEHQAAKLAGMPLPG